MLKNTYFQNYADNVTSTIIIQNSVRNLLGINKSFLQRIQFWLRFFVTVWNIKHSHSQLSYIVIYRFLIQPGIDPGFTRGVGSNVKLEGALHHKGTFLLEKGIFSIVLSWKRALWGKVGGTRPPPCPPVPTPLGFTHLQQASSFPLDYLVSVFWLVGRFDLALSPRPWWIRCYLLSVYVKSHTMSRDKGVGVLID